MHRREYEAPKVSDYGTLRDLTASTNNFGKEDGGAKGVQNVFGGTGKLS